MCQKFHQPFPATENQVVVVVFLPQQQPSHVIRFQECKKRRMWEEKGEGVFLSVHEKTATSRRTGDSNAHHHHHHHHHPERKGGGGGFLCMQAVRQAGRLKTHTSSARVCYCCWEWCDPRANRWRKQRMTQAKLFAEKQ